MGKRVKKYYSNGAKNCNQINRQETCACKKKKCRECFPVATQIILPIPVPVPCCPLVCQQPCLPQINNCYPVQPCLPIYQAPCFPQVNNCYHQFTNSYY